MRREFEEFNRIFPQYASPHKGVVYRMRLRIRKAVLRLRMRKIKSGSENWHKLQHQISRLSTTEDDMIIRSLFYERSIKCKGKIYVLPNSIMCYPYRISMGYNVFINRNVYITARERITIGDNVLIGPGVVINSGMHKYNDKDKLIRDQGHILKPIIIGDDVWIGANTVIMPGVSIGKGSIIGAGAIVKDSIPPYSVAVGVPAKVIKKRG